jgi:aldehyde dehydrogenase (NAD+)
MVTNLMTTHDSVFIGGDCVAPATRDRIEVVSPWSEDVIAAVPAGSREDVDRAVAAARRVLDAGPWPSMSLEERVAILMRFRELLLERSEELAQLITAEMGCSLTPWSTRCRS